MLGEYLNVLPIVMAILMFLQTKMTQRGMTAQQDNPVARAMSGPIMPIVFGIMFYNMPSALVLYWMTNSLLTVVWYRVAK